MVLDWTFHPNPFKPSLVTLVMFTVQSFALPALSLGYASTVVLLWQDPVWQRRLMPFSYVGRMALTNYLLQSLICTTIFYSYGLGLYGRVGPLANIFLGLAIYSAQVPFSRWWLSTHRYGPMEWIWRRMTYGRIAAALAGPCTPDASLLSQFLDLFLRALPHQRFQIVGRLSVLRQHLDRLLRVAERFFLVPERQIPVRQTVVGIG